MSGNSSQSGRGVQRKLRVQPQPPVFSIADNEADREQGFLYTAQVDGMRGGFAADRFVLMINKAGTCEKSNGAPHKKSGVRLDYRFAGDARSVMPELFDELPSKRQRLTETEAGIVTELVPLHQRVIYRNLWPQIDVVYYGSDGGLKYDLIVHPGGSVTDIQFEVSGIEMLTVDNGGSLILATAMGSLMEEPPVCHQLFGGLEVPIKCRFTQLGPTRYGFEVVDNYDRNEALVIDPLLLYANFSFRSPFTSVQVPIRDLDIRLEDEEE